MYNFVVYDITFNRIKEFDSALTGGIQVYKDNDYVW